MRDRKLFSRRGEILRLMRKLEWDGFPRLQMLFLVILTGAAGMVASYALLRSGVDSMALLKIQLHIEAEYGFWMPDEDLVGDNIASARALANYICGRRRPS